MSTTLRTVGLEQSEVNSLAECLKTWESTKAKNALLDVYHDGHKALHDFGISIPPAMRTVKMSLGWPQKAVSALARKHIFEGFSQAGRTDPFGINELLDRNEFESEFVQAASSAYKHSCSFITTTPGTESEGDPTVVIAARDARWSSAVWDKRRRELASMLAITDTRDYGTPSEAILLTRSAVIHLANNVGVWRVVDRWDHSLNRVLAEPLVHDPQLSRPFGRSRITREVRYLTDAGIRSLLRTEVTAEFFSAPQRYAIGAREDAFSDMDRWTAVTGRMLALELNEEGDKPDLGTFASASPQPNLEVYRQLAQNFCSATGLPQSSVGLFSDTPASAEAMIAAEASLAEDGEYQWRVFKPRLRRIQQNVIMLAEGTTEPPAESWSTNVNWTPCRFVSPQAASDWAVKAVGADETLAGSTVVQRRLGLSQGEIEEVKSERGRTNAGSILDRVLAGAAPASAEPVTLDDDAR